MAGLIKHFTEGIAERRKAERDDAEIKKNRSDIEFIAMMTDTDIFDDEEEQEVEDGEE